MTSNKLIDLTGKRFGELTVFSKAFGYSSSGALWFCFCACGALTEVQSGALRSGRSKSCGCARNHGLRNHPIYNTYRGMKERCCSPKHKSFKYYGGKGIRVCEEWLTDFKVFYSWSILNGYAKGLELDRLESNKDYSPKNCEWVTHTVNVCRSGNRVTGNTPFIGVSLTPTGKYQAAVGYRGKQHYVGSFEDPKDAAQARDNLIMERGWPHKLNFNCGN